MSLNILMTISQAARDAILECQVNAADDVAPSPLRRNSSPLPQQGGLPSPGYRFGKKTGGAGNGPP